ncbi:MAG: DUF4198 domain-containing protein [Pseudomonadota bacterium]
MRTAISLTIAALAMTGAAMADTAYIEPSTFAPKLEQTITVETSFNDYCCVPKYPVRSQSFAVITPDGSETAPDRIELFANSTVLEHTVMHAGTTRFTTGERLGRKGGEFVLLDGDYYMVNSDDAEPIEVPDGTPILSSQTATVSDSYVTIGDPTWASVEASIGRLVMTPLAHPSSLSKGDTLTVALSFDGEPLAGQSLVLTRSGQAERPGDEGISFVSDPTGKIEIPLEHIGTHLIMTRLQAPAPADAETDIRSYTTSLTFHVGL